MVLPLTQIEGVPSRQGLIRGTAYFAGTGPASEKCGTCKHYGYYRKSRFGNTYQTQACWMFRKLTGKYGPRLNRETPSCKYFEKKDNKKPPRGAGDDLR